MPEIPPYLSRADVPRYYPVSLRLVDQWIAASALPVIRVGAPGRRGKPILRRDDIERYLNSCVAAKPKPKRGRPTKAEQVARRSLAVYYNAHDANYRH